ncbi:MULTISPECIES: hypothetical protein [Pseudomonas]|uniref:Uncharacterized protein n=1 Tax=Pseudomonas idahonensis TaxID=2942628 RepID=A0ABT5Q7I4_9PSED|nr:hypothetical protein [Pseudomonas idahonensis]MDD1149602.1 hypothetical protein [Pseudomonas idahonensis]
MNKLNSILCERCGERLEVFSENSSKGSRCPGCGWSVVTTDIPGIKIDETKYEVKCGGDYKNKDHIKAVSEVVGCNFVVAREILKKDLSLVFVGQAVEVLRVKGVLLSAGVYCVISPEFKWG